MLFNSFEFFIFFPIVTMVYFILPHRYRWGLLLGASYYFYMAWNPKYIVLIILSTIIDYFAAIMMERHKEKRDRRKYLYMSLISNLGMLFFFKYFVFIEGNIKSVASFLGFGFQGSGIEKILVPMGISFYTFQTLSYTIDVYKGERKAERHFGIFALYVTFFPQLVAGPIERSDRLIPQFFEKHQFSYDRVVSGLRRILWGLFKKMVIADNISRIVNIVYESPKEYYGWPLIIATVAFAIQIYCDFSGYSDIAIGSARVLGFRLMENFKTPYFSRSIQEFWGRWHISLSTWFKDYVYIPLGGNRIKVTRGYMNLVITFMISGLWHGANWTFFIWGMLNGVYLVLEKIMKPLCRWGKEKFKLRDESIVLAVITRVWTFSLVCIGWIFFRGNTLEDSLYIVTNLAKGLGNIKSMTYIKNKLLPLITAGVGEVPYEVRKLQAVALFVGVLVLMISQWRAHRDDAIEVLKGKSVAVRWCVYTVIVMSVVMFGVFNGNDFIYFQF